MIVKEITLLEQYKQLDKNQTFKFVSDDESSDFNLSIFIGRNGSGKTTLMSLIPNLFHHIERYSGKIEANFMLTYELQISGEAKEITLIHHNNLILINSSDLQDIMQIVPRKDAHNYDFSVVDKQKPYIKYEDIRHFLPKAVVMSTFSMHGEYPTARPWNYIGDEIVVDQSISYIYGNNHYNIGSISKGILRFVSLFRNKQSEMESLLDLFDLKFTYMVDINQVGWSKVDDSFFKLYHDWDYMSCEHLNDIEFERHGRKIKLSNMSSGEKMLLLRTISILNSIQENSIVLIEEPELHLDQVWNRQLISLFKLLFSNYNSHIMITTHDYSIIKSVPKTNLLPLYKGKFEEIKGNTFLASYDELFKVLYGDNFKSNIIEEEYLRNISRKSLDRLHIDFEMLGNSIYKYLVYREIKKRGTKDVESYE